MPLFAFVCKQCGAQSELLVRADEQATCPSCGAGKMERQMSRFATLSGSSMPEPACGGCAMARDGSCPSAEQAGCMP